MSEKAKKTLRIIVISVLSLVVAVDTFFLVLLYGIVREVTNEPVIPSYVTDMSLRLSLLENQVDSSANAAENSAENA